MYQTAKASSYEHFQSNEISPNGMMYVGFLHIAGDIGLVCIKSMSIFHKFLCKNMINVFMHPSWSP